ncbi:nucleoside 2-deoxyribosyltransferase [Pedobacter gandavensis]|uniref:nucleoside 2-deoxyribosyltransferase n=1 Tax=Pedobacter gandavensis TaxID=2679963 RepID=UPI00292EA72A|nr:nucleoside 2-deoxyribosyltransferase [Pedobacter gandavensis]
MSQPKILLIGDVLVDVTLETSEQELKMRLGGIIHAARGLWAMNINYSVAYFSPSYLDLQIHDYLKEHGCIDVIKLGNVTGSPYVFLIKEVKEVGDQGYDFLLREDIEITYDQDAFNLLAKNNYEDILMISGNYDQARLINHISGNIHIDIANNVMDLSYFESLNKKIKTVFISTSSTLFQSHFFGDLNLFNELFKNYTDKIILKENRGGSRGYNFITGESFSASAQTSKINHSVGVGDVFDACFIAKVSSIGLSDAMILSSWLAYEYALTTYPDDFKNATTRLLKMKTDHLAILKGVALPWENRNSINIYIAAPDFDFVDTSLIDKLCESLIYHNFTPRRPIKENGQMELEALKSRKQDLFNADMNLISECSILLAVLLFNDPGTLIEIGLAYAKGIPTIVYDPFNKAENCMLTELPLLVSSDLDHILSEIFIVASKINVNE